MKGFINKKGPTCGQSLLLLLCILTVKLLNVDSVSHLLAL